MNRTIPEIPEIPDTDTCTWITPRSRRYYIWTVGCQMNISDSERLEVALLRAGYTPAERPEDAGFIVLNSCSVRASAEQRIIGKLHELKHVKQQHPDTRIILWGCMVGPGNQSIFHRRLPMVDHVVAPSNLDDVLSLAPEPILPFDTPVLPIREGVLPPVSVFVPIQYGCNMQCAYCIIPLRRGRERSRPLEEIGHEVQQIVARGTREIILLGQIVDSWGHDLPGRPDLGTLLTTLHDIPGMVRLRFLTSHPAWMTSSLIETVANLPRCQHEINLPVQSGHDHVLSLMQRGYTVGHYRSLVARIRAAIPDVALATDIIVGHPGETRECFEHSRALLEELRFDKVHIAAFSARPGTRAAEMERDPVLAVPYEEKQARRIELDAIQKQIATEINARFLGQTVDVLVEGQAKGKWQGRTPGNRLVFFAHTEDCTGQVVHVHITRTSPWSLQGNLSR